MFIRPYNSSNHTDKNVSRPLKPLTRKPTSWNITDIIKWGKMLHVPLRALCPTVHVSLWASYVFVGISCPQCWKEQGHLFLHFSGISGRNALFILLAAISVLIKTKWKWSMDRGERDDQDKWQVWITKWVSFLFLRLNEQEKCFRAQGKICK